MSRTHRTARRPGFSLIELVIVVVIIGIIAAIAIPRMSRGTAGAADSALSGNLNVLRNAIELYATEHNGKFPGDGTATTPATTEKALTEYTNDAGESSETKTATHIYGPYLRKIPPVTVGPLKNVSPANAEFNTTTVDTVDSAPTKGWLYNKNTGVIKANVASTGLPDDPGKDQNGKLYSEY